LVAAADRLEMEAMDAFIDESLADVEGWTA
jgi:hypothetical protein